MATLIDDFTLAHLGRWLDSMHWLDEADRELQQEMIFGLIASDPDLLQRHSWPEIHRLAVNMVRGPADNAH